MEKITNSVCNVAIDNSYKYFNEVVCYFNEKNNCSINDIYDNILIITDQNVYNHQLDKLIDNINAKSIYEYIIPSGEDSKSLSMYEEIMKYCVRMNLSRKSVIVALGGGVVGDLAGYVASTYMRGIDVIQIPTSLLAQVDSSIGGKTGINLDNFKNIIGTFYQPKLTYINVDALKTLNEEEFLSGMAEVIKYAVIYDYKFLDYLIENSKSILNRESEHLYYIVKKCASIKVDVVGIDEKEGGLRKILNFGHTFGHGVEKLCKISHGYAVSIGMNMAFKLSLKESIISNDYYELFVKVCNKYDLPLTFKMEDGIDSSNNIEEEILNIMKSDKKNSFGKINLVLPIDLGKVEVIDSIEEDKILQIIKECHNA
ncbi:3-dehydroquinate synthase [Clostridium sp. CCUG 7971]|uniref:3-dehydroquinate synthase n=1 Tax=Clostridium sp. CCUG 7971 TaxID=2811414 RepID=UPI001ABB25AF|nr:3-dehydroquinate synthase [Clostridium sp. CCUG 7971]MBO3443326.1 3-dehydroquinate synthase [Clostridium sp. CCUG 7971]